MTDHDAILFSTQLRYFLLGMRPSTHPVSISEDLSSNLLVLLIHSILADSSWKYNSPLRVDPIDGCTSTTCREGELQCIVCLSLDSGDIIYKSRDIQLYIGLRSVREQTIES